MDPNLKKKKRSRVSPADLNSRMYNNAFEMEDTDEDKTKNFNGKSLRKNSAFKNSVDNVAHKRNALHAITNAKSSGNKWRQYVTTRRLHKHETSGQEDINAKGKSQGLGLEGIHKDFVNTDSVDAKFSTKYRAEANQSLIHYFAELGRKTDETVNVNLHYIESLLNNGAQVDCKDKHGQSVLHEVARAWHCDVAKFLIENGADVNIADNYGRTPLHVAAAVDYPEMVHLLIDHQADKEANTKGENQTPVHYAAKHDACQSLRALIKRGCEYKLVTDYKGRTPIHVAAELDRSETARMLLEFGAPVGVSDNSGQKAITLMITKMPPVARDALDQFHKTYRAERKQYFYLNYLIKDTSMKEGSSQAQSPLQVAVAHKQHEILTHKVLLRLLYVHWHGFARRYAWRAIAFNLIFIILWTVLGATIEYDKKHIYTFPEQWWRLTLSILAVGLTVYQIVEEFREYYKSRKSHNLWKKWRETEILKDLKFAHPQWPEEEKFLKREIDNLDNIKPKYFNDWWNVFDWCCYVLLLASIITHVADILAHSELLARWHIRIMAFNIILLWLRLMKNARAFEPLGPFIVILAHMFGDVFRFAFLYLEFYIPFVCAFWMMFGGEKYPEGTAGSPNATEIVVNRFQYINEVFFTLFRLTLVDEYDYDNMKLVDSLMADVLLGAWFALSAILCLNLFIALLSDTFQRVYDNARANAVMQKAITVLSIWDSLVKQRRVMFLKSLEKPIEDDYDDDITISGDEDLKKVTIQIKEQLDEMQEGWEKIGLLGNSTVMNGNAPVSQEKFESELITLRDGLTELRASQEKFIDHFQRDMQWVMSTLVEMSSQRGGVIPSAFVSADSTDMVRRRPSDLLPLQSSPPREGRTKPQRKKKKRTISSDDLTGGVGLGPAPGIHMPSESVGPTNYVPGTTTALEVTPVALISPPQSPRPQAGLPSRADVRFRTDVMGEAGPSQDDTTEV